MTGGAIGSGDTSTGDASTGDVGAQDAGTKHVGTAQTTPGLGWPGVRVSYSRGLGWPGQQAAPEAATAAEDTVRAPAERHDTSLDDSTTPLASVVERELAARIRASRRDPLPRPPQPRVLVVANQKGGVGKTTTTVNIAAALALHDLRVLVIDLDPQGNASTALAVDHSEGSPGVYKALIDFVPLQELVVPGPFERLSVIPASIDLAGAEIELVSVDQREFRLRRSLLSYLAVAERQEQPIDYVLIDCPPSLGLLTLNALVAANEMLIPIQSEYYALEGLGQLVRNVELIQQHLNPALQLSTILLTMVDARTRLSADVAAEVRRHFGERVLRTVIPRSVRLSEAPSHRQTVLAYDASSTGALAYLEAAREIALGRDHPAN